MKNCRDCGLEFEKKTTAKGFINQCNDCSESDETVKYIGYNDGSLNKSTHTSIYRGKDPAVLKHLLKKLQTVG